MTFCNLVSIPGFASPESPPPPTELVTVAAPLRILDTVAWAAEAKPTSGEFIASTPNASEINFSN